MKKQTITRDSSFAREIAPKIRVLNEEEGLVEYVASDETLDSYNEIIVAGGWRFSKRFKANPVFLDSHSYWGIKDLLGRVTSMEVKDGQLIEVVKWAIDVASNATAKLGFEMTAKGYLKAVSVGFNPVKWVHRSDDEFTAVADSMPGLSNEDRDAVRVIYQEQQQLELSSCVIGANPSALAKAANSGEIPEEYFVNCGVNEDSIDAIQLAGHVIDNATTHDTIDVARMHLGMMLRSQRQISDIANVSRSTSSPPERGSAGEEARQRSRELSRDSLKAIAEKLGV